MSLLPAYEQRTEWKYEPIHGLFHTHDGLSRKVAPDGGYIPFPGSTVVFRPERQCRQVIRLMQRRLFHKLNGTDMLASSLPLSTTHMTLHDLISPEMCAADFADERRYAREVTDSISRAVKIVEEIRRDYAGRRIKMVSDRIVNMVSKSLALLLRPQTEQDYELLLELYGRFDCIQKLPYPLTPHITLAYFRPGMLDGGRLGEAVDFAQINPENAPVFEFHPEGLSVQRFLDMQTYMDVPARICFCWDGGLDRSVMAANILNRLAGERGLPVTGEARAVFQNTQGWSVSERVWETLEKNGILPDRTYLPVRYLEDSEVSHFTYFAGISDGAAERIYRLCPTQKGMYDAGRYFFGVRDPEHGEITYEQAFKELYDRAAGYLDAFEADYRKRIKE